MIEIALPRGTRLAQYEINEVIGQGGFGITYHAYDHEFGREVAIKEHFPRTAAIRDADGTVLVCDELHEEVYRKQLTRFWEEAETLARFNHPNIVRVLQRLAANGTAYLVLEYLSGPSLDQWLQQAGRPANQGELDGFCRALLDALETIHANNFLHRDIAPKNILLRMDGLPVLIDFGSARKLSPSAQMTAMVTPSYAPHEQYLTSGQGQGPWSDIYSAAATVYRMIAGRPPLDANTRVLDETQYEPISQLAAARGYRRSFLQAVDWALQVYAKDRPASVALWRTSLLDGVSTTPTLA